MELFIELGLLLAVTTGIAIIMRMIKQPLIVGYIISGIVLGPFVFNIIQSQEQIELFSKIGIAILLFIVGLSLNPKTIKETGVTSLITGLGQIVFTSIVGYVILHSMGFSAMNAIYGAVALTLSSTIIILKLLSDRGDMQTLYGKVAIGFLLVQDIVATLLLVLIPVIGSSGTSQEMLGVTIGLLLGKGILALLGIWIIARWITPRLSHYLARSQELLFLFSVTWGIVFAGLFAWLGFSIEVGALIAGVTFSTSPYALEMVSRLRPLRDFFIVLFFILLGAGLVVGSILKLLIPALLLSAFVLIGNPLIMFTIMNLIGYRNRTGFMAGLTVAQISEFSLILLALGLSLGHISQDLMTLITLVGIITIAGSTYMVLSADWLYEKLAPALRFISLRKNHRSEPEYHPEKIDMIIFGYGRVGKEFVRTLQDMSQSYTVVDYDPVITRGNSSVPIIFGDAEDVEFFEEIQLSTIPMVVSTIPDRVTNEGLVSWYRARNTSGIVIAVAHTTQDAEALYSLGASYVLLPHYLGAYHGAKMIRDYQTDPDIFTKAKTHQGRQIVRMGEHL